VRRGRKQSDDQVHQRGFATAGGTDDGEEFAFVDPQIGFEQRLHAPAFGAKHVTDPMDRDHSISRRRRLHGGGSIGRLCGCNRSAHLPIQLFARAIRECRESRIILSSAAMR